MDASSLSLNAFVKDNVEESSLIYTETWKGYSQLKKSGYRDVITNQSTTVGDASLPLIHRIASLLRRWLMGTHQGAVSHDHLDYYLDEFTFRFNRRTSTHRGNLFYRLLQNAVMIEPKPIQNWLLLHVLHTLATRLNSET